MELQDRLKRRAVDGFALLEKVKHRCRESVPEEQEISRQRTAFYERIWREAAEALGGEVTSLQGSLLEVRAGDRRLLIKKNETSLDDPVTVGLSRDKDLVRRLLSEAGIPVPRGVVCRFDDVATAWRFLRETGAPCVVKPAKQGIGGLGVTTGITSQSNLMRALSHGRVHDRELLIEEMVDGGVYRLLYFDGELLDAVLRSPPTITGDGSSTIERLLARENTARSRDGSDAAQTHIKLDADLRHTLRSAGLDLHSVLPAGKSVVVKRVINDNRREQNLPAAEAISPELAALGARAAGLVGLRLAGVDVITDDPGVPLAESSGVVLEVNADPGLYYHYMKAGAGTPVARMILERLTSGSESRCL